MGTRRSLAVSHHRGRYGIEIRAVSYHQGRYGIEIMINSSFGNGTRSWVTIVNGINKYATEMSAMTLETEQGNLLLKHDRNKHQVSSSIEVSKQMRLLRHDQTVPREEDGAVEFRILASMFHSRFTSSPYWSIRTWLNYLQRGGGAKKRYQ